MILLKSVSWASLLVPVLVNVAFFTLLERKILGLSQSRKGPAKVSVMGVLQPFADAIKLFVKEVSWPKMANKAIYGVAPVGAIFLALATWGVLPLEGRSPETLFSGVVLLVLMSLGLYPLMAAGWASMSGYASVGAMRGVAQTISYEISLALVLLSFLTAQSSATWSGLSPALGGPMLLWLPCAGLWLICCVAETNRTPFDFAEGESELVSGFNIEYGGGTFALIFMAEYASILALSFLTALIVLGGRLSGPLAAMSLTLAFFWVWLRATLPRYRYDKLMSLAWKTLLPGALSVLIFYTIV